MNITADHCAGLVRERNYERYLGALYAPARLRPHLFAIYAFDEEVARIADAVTEPLAGEIRLQWWRDAVDSLAEGATGNPVARAVQSAIREHGLPSDLFHAAIDARSFDLSGAAMPDCEHLDAYLDATAGSTMGLAIRLLAPDSAAAAAPAALAAARAAGLLRLLRNLARQASHGRVYLPESRLAFHGGSSADVLRGEATPAVLRVIAELNDRMGEWMQSVAAIRVSPAAIPALLEAAVVPAYRRELKRPGYSPFERPLEIGRLRALWRVWRAARIGSIRAR
jgi:phytoene synthase